MSVLNTHQVSVITGRFQKQFHFCLSENRDFILPNQALCVCSKIIKVSRIANCLGCIKYNIFYLTLSRSLFLINKRDEATQLRSNEDALDEDVLGHTSHAVPRMVTLFLFA